MDILYNVKIRKCFFMSYFFKKINWSKPCIMKMCYALTIIDSQDLAEPRWSWLCSKRLNTVGFGWKIIRKVQCYTLNLEAKKHSKITATILPRKLCGYSHLGQLEVLFRQCSQFSLFFLGYLYNVPMIGLSLLFFSKVIYNNGLLKSTSITSL